MLPWMIYGAYGYTGELIARTAVANGMNPILAGRDSARVNALAHELGVASRSFELEDPNTIGAGLSGCSLVLNCAGPFADTSGRLAAGAIRAGAHYLDITGEWAVFEALQAFDAAARAAGVMLLPGVGFDVVPTDCIAVALKESLPDASSLELAFVGPNRAASGSIKTALRALPEGSLIREQGRLRSIPHFSRSRGIRVGEKEQTVYAIPWGDLVTAYHSTGIPNIAVYTVFPRSQVLALSAVRPGLGLLRRPTVRRVAEAVAEFAVAPPGEDYLRSGRFTIWGEVSNPAGERRTLALESRDTYSVTRASAVLIVGHVLAGDFRPGFQTPARAFGPELIDKVDGTRRLEA